MELQQEELAPAACALGLFHLQFKVTLTDLSRKDLQIFMIFAYFCESETPFMIGIYKPKLNIFKGVLQDYTFTTTHINKTGSVEGHRLISHDDRRYLDTNVQCK